MPPIKHSQPNPSPEIEYGEINIPDDKNLGEGRFITVLRPRALVANKPIMSIMINVPVFQISVNINPQTNLIPVLLGKAGKSDPLSRKVYRIPKDIDKLKRLTIVASFKNWQITGLALDENSLEEN